MDNPKYKIVLSDCHISAGRYFEGKLNPYEDFHFDEEFIDLIEYFSTGIFGIDSHGSVEVELILNGDFFDFLNVPLNGEFVDTITEEVALYKINAIINGHPKIFAGLKRFLSLPNKTITYLLGNHDIDLAFERVRERLCRELDPEAVFPSEKVRVQYDKEGLSFPQGIEIRHGNQFIPGSWLDFKKLVVHGASGKPTLNLPWSSYFVLKIINRLKWERKFIDHIRPIKAYILFGLLLDPWFTIRFCFLSGFYFIKTRLAVKALKPSFRIIYEALRKETKFLIDLEEDARKMLSENEGVQTVIFGHSHKPMNTIYPDGKQYINTGTWTKMINLDWQGLGQQFKRTFVLITVKNDHATCELRQWVGQHSPHNIFNG